MNESFFYLDIVLHGIFGFVLVVYLFFLLPFMFCYFAIPDGLFIERMIRW